MAPLLEGIAIILGDRFNSY
ncbi:Hypothetical protein F387_00262 [Wohlfahrtiimonas chitiniclastica SH04]|uniref:Uncharacterized protein n=1 Tax=Wohlfahrtiimonas chitiniclastica SH04 TaxID=1261130 RepID=L8Y1E1_9GAMM|nr:Hypothetical protein F387_00262 [Wohlfahrtiimonas chitiniclastica SH04]